MPGSAWRRGTHPQPLSFEKRGATPAPFAYRPPFSRILTFHGFPITSLLYYYTNCCCKKYINEIASFYIHDCVKTRNSMVSHDMDKPALPPSPSFRYTWRGNCI